MINLTSSSAEFLVALQELEQELKHLSISGSILENSVVEKSANNSEQYFQNPNRREKKMPSSKDSENRSQQTVMIVPNGTEQQFNTKSSSFRPLRVVVSALVNGRTVSELSLTVTPSFDRSESRKPDSVISTALNTNTTPDEVSQQYYHSISTLTSGQNVTNIQQIQQQRQPEMIQKISNKNNHFTDDNNSESGYGNWPMFSIWITFVFITLALVISIVVLITTVHSKKRSRNARTCEQKLNLGLKRNSKQNFDKNNVLFEDEISVSSENDCGGGGSGNSGNIAQNTKRVQFSFQTDASR